MSNVSGGSGWWRASDGQWYPPSSTPPSLLCPNGHPVTEDARFCTECGAPLHQPTCPNGHAAIPGNAFCVVCGAAMANTSSHAAATSQQVPGAVLAAGAVRAAPAEFNDAQPTAQPPVHQDRKKHLIIGGVVAVTVVAAVVAVVALTGSSSSAYPANMQKALLSVMEKTGATKQAATCVLHWMESHVSITQLEKSTGAQQHTWGTDAGSACLGTFPGLSKLNASGFGSILTTNSLTTTSNSAHHHTTQSTISSGGSTKVHCTRTTTRSLGTCTSTANTGTNSGTSGSSSSTGGRSNGSSSTRGTTGGSLSGGTGT